MGSARLTSIRTGWATPTRWRYRPQTLYGLADSPVGLAAWMLDHDIRSYQMIARVFDGKPEGLTRDDVLDNITLYWLTNTAISSARLYWDTTHNLPPGGFFDARGVKLPVAVSAFRGRNLSGAEELGGEGLSEAHPLQQASQRRALRGLGTACALRVRCARNLQIASFGVTMRRTARASGARRTPSRPTYRNQEIHQCPKTSTIPAAAFSAPRP